MQKTAAVYAQKVYRFGFAFLRSGFVKRIWLFIKYPGLPGSIFESAAMAVCLQAKQKSRRFSFYPFCFSMDFSMLNGFLAQDFENARPDCRYGFGHPRTRNF